MSESVEVAIGVIDGKVIAKWVDPITEIAFDPANAYSVGLALSRAAMEAHNGTKLKGDLEFIEGELAQVKVKVTDAQRDMMIMTVASILRTFMDQKKSPGYMAMCCVDEVLKETAR